MLKTYEFCTLQDGTAVTAYELTNSFGESATILNYGAVLASLKVLDRNGSISDVVLGADPGQDVQQCKYLGSVMGRCGNRIAYAKFSIDGREYKLTPREGPHHLHGVKGNWAKQMFSASADDNSVTLQLLDDGADGWECEAEAEIKYSFDDSHALSIEYSVKAGGDTVISPTNHAYFNLNAPEEVLDTELKIFTADYAPKSELHMPDGRIAAVEGTPLDFRDFRSISGALKGSESFFPEYQSAFDDFYVLPGSGFRQAAEARCPENGRVMRVFTDAQSLILYTPQASAPLINKGGMSYCGSLAFCLETQFVPNAVNCPEYRSPVFRRGETMRSRTVYAFDLY